MPGPHCALFARNCCNPSNPRAATGRTLFAASSTFAGDVRRNIASEAALTVTVRPAVTPRGAVRCVSPTGPCRQPPHVATLDRFFCASKTPRPRPAPATARKTDFSSGRRAPSAKPGAWDMSSGPVRPRS
eukprot:364197-Chlamydomonas_euryale.AAC.54